METVSQSLLGIVITLAISGCLAPALTPPTPVTDQDTARVVEWAAWETAGVDPASR